MGRVRVESVAEYLAKHPRRTQLILRRVRTAIRKALPDAEEVISYQIPAYRMHGRIVIFFAGWRQHYSIYPAIGKLVATFQEELAPYKLSKGTVRFPLDEPVPVQLIARLAKLRAAEVAAEARSAKPSTKR